MFLSEYKARLSELNNGYKPLYEEEKEVIIAIIKQMESEKEIKF